MKKKSKSILIIYLLILMIFTTFTGYSYKVKASSTTSLNVYKTDYKSVSAYLTSSYNSFPASIPYSTDSEGFSGNYYPSGSSYVISGSAPTVIGQELAEERFIYHAVHEVQYAHWYTDSSGTGGSVPDSFVVTVSPEYDSIWSSGMGWVQLSSQQVDWVMYTPDYSGAVYLAYQAYENATVARYNNIYSADTRVWQQNYSGTVAHTYLDYILDAEVTTDMPSEMCKGDTYTFNITAKNTGTNTWTSASNIYLTKSGTFPMPTTFLLPNGVSVKPNESYTWNVTVVAPDTGTYTAVYQMKQTGQGYFGNVSNNNITVIEFNVTANIERILSPHDPIFKEGEKGVIKINIVGGVDKLIITFPVELTTIDNTLNKVMILTPKPSDTINYEFFVPIGTINKDYNVEIQAYKSLKEKDVYPAFSVAGNILDDIRTRIRIRR
jgi:hypothetical protein